MASRSKQVQQSARQFLKLSIVEGVVSADRVAGILQYIEKHRPANSVAILKAYHRLISSEIARREARIEHAGSANPAMLAGIAASMTRRYGRPISQVAQRNDALLAGLRIRVGDDVYESSVASQLAALASSV